MTYTCLAAETMTGKLIAELPISGLTYDITVNAPASFAGTVRLDAAPGLWDATAPGKTSLYIDVDGTLVYGGIIWGRQYTKSSRSLALDGGDVGSYLEHLVLDFDHVFTGIEQLALARFLVAYGMSKPGADLRMLFSTVTTGAAQLRDRTYLAADRANILARLTELSAVEGGFDFRFSARWEGGYARRVFLLGYPTLGRAYPGSGVVFDFEADASELTFTEDAAAQGNYVYTVGAVPDGSPDGTLPPTYNAADYTVMAQGYPRMDTTASYDSVTTSTVLGAHARGLLAADRMPAQTMTLTVRDSPAAPPLGSYLPGDQCQVNVGRGGDLWPTGAAVLAVITSVSVTVDDQGDPAATVGLAPLSITLGAP